MLAYILTAARQGTDYSGLRTFLSTRQLTMDQPMCVDIAITDDLKVEDRELFRVFLFPRTSFGVDALFTPRRTTVVIDDDDAPSKYTITLRISKMPSKNASQCSELALVKCVLHTG